MQITFTYKEKNYEGHLKKVSGAGTSSMWHLYIGDRFRGQLFLSQFNNKWTFSSNDGMFEDLGERFGELIKSCD